jgi:O-antigen ligase
MLERVSVARTIAWFTFAAMPLGLMPGIFLSHDVMPKVIFLLIGAAFLLFLLPQWWGGIEKLQSTQRGRWFVWLVVAQAVLLALSTLFSEQPLLSFAGTTWRRFGMVEQIAGLVVACAIAALAAAKPESTSALWRLCAVCGGIASIYGISQYFGFDPLLDRRLYSIDYLGGITRPPATMGHAIYYSAYLVPIALIAAWQAGAEKSRQWRTIHAAVAALAPLAILLSGSRGALLGLAGAWIFLIAHMRPSRKLISVATAASLAAIALVAFSPAGATLRHRVAQWREDPGSARLGVWRESPELISKAPLLGSGPETFATAFRAVESAELSRAYPDFYQETPHNAFIDAACSEGLPGTLILVGIFALALSGKGPYGLRAAIVGTLICSLFASFSIVTATYLWAAAGILSAEAPKKAATAKTARLKAKKTDAPSALVPIGILGGVAFLAVAVMLGVQDAAYAELGRAVNAKDLSGARRALKRATSFGIGMPGYELWSSQELSKLSAWNDARDAAALAALRGEDRFSAVYQASLLEIVNGDASGAESKASEAIGLAPNWYKPHLLRAQILEAMGRNREAAQEAQQSLKLGWKGK